MRYRLVGLVAALMLSACSRGPSFLRSKPPTPAPNADTLYWKAIYHLDAANRQGSLDSAAVYLDAYVAAGLAQPRRREAMVLRQLTRDAQQLARVQGALQQQTRADTTTRATDGDSKRRDEEALKEIQRLKEELAKANEELDRIRKRLAAPKPPEGR